MTRVVLALAAAGLVASCATVRRAGTGSPEPGELDRAALARCAHAGPDGWGAADVDGLEGEWRLYLSGEDGSRAAGPLVLRPPDADGAGGPGTGLAPLLVGWSAAPFEDVGAIVPGAADARDPAAPGVALYAFEHLTEDAEEDGASLVTLLRVGSESNRRDRQRFDGAHTTLRLASIDDDRFGGTWTSAEAADARGGSFCAVRP